MVIEMSLLLLSASSEGHAALIFARQVSQIEMELLLLTASETSCVHQIDFI